MMAFLVALERESGLARGQPGSGNAQIPDVNSCFRYEMTNSYICECGSTAGGDAALQSSMLQLQVSLENHKCIINVN